MKLSLQSKLAPALILPALYFLICSPRKACAQDPQSTPPPYFGSKGSPETPEDIARLKRSGELEANLKRVVMIGDQIQIYSVSKQNMEIDPKSNISLFWFADSAFKLGKQREAIEAYRSLNYSRENGFGGSVGHDPATRMRFVICLLKSRLWNEAVDVFNETLKLQTEMKEFIPDNEREFVYDRTDYIRMGGIAHLVVGSKSLSFMQEFKKDYEGHLRAALRLRPDLIRAHFFLGKLLHNKGQYDQAIAEYKFVIAGPTSPFKSQAKYNLSEVEAILEWNKKSKAKGGAIKPEAP